MRQTVTKKLSKIGDGIGVVLDQQLLEQLGLDESSEVEIITDGSVILIAPKRDQQRLEEIADWVFEKYAGAFKKLAE